MQKKKKGTKIFAKRINEGSYLKMRHIRTVNYNQKAACEQLLLCSLNWHTAVLICAGVLPSSSLHATAGLRNCCANILALKTKLLPSWAFTGTTPRPVCQSGHMELKGAGLLRALAPSPVDTAVSPSPASLLDRCCAG